jgi:TrmH family RNA methyltransferase
MILSRLFAPMPRAETLRSRANPVYKRPRALTARPDRELCFLEGPRLVLEALEAGVAVVEAAASERAEASPAGRAALAALRQRGVPLRPMSAALVSSLSETETSQGLVALARRPSLPGERIFRGTPLLLVADGVQNPGNLGGLLRTAEAAGASGALLAGGCADPFSWKALRGSMGSAFRVPHLRGIPIDQALDLLEARRIPVLATTAQGERRYDEADLRGPVAIVVGAEGAGLPATVLERAAARLRIPLRNPVESLNVGVAAALVLFEAARQRGFRGAGPEG